MSRLYCSWLPREKSAGLFRRRQYFSSVICRSQGKLISTAAGELERTAGLIGADMSGENAGGKCFILDTDACLGAGGYRVSTDERAVTVTGGDEAGVLYGVYRYLILAAADMPEADSVICEKPAYRFRMLDHWDNADGSVERGYSGNSLFFRGGNVTDDEEMLTDYARLMSSAGINAVCINNVNVDAKETLFITDRYLGAISLIAEVFGRYGIKLFLSVNFAAPVQLGELDTADPLDRRVREWWRNAAEHIYSVIPDFGGFLVKADSENRPGPHTYGRDHSEGANMLAEALEPFGGVLIWRCFVYNCHVDWRDRSTDRAKAAYDNFMPLDGKFADNVYLQIKNGPMDFQVREPVSPLFGGLEHTNMIAEFQIAQEYTGQQIDLCWLVPMWKECLGFNTHGGSPVSSRICGAAGVANTGDGAFLTGSPLAAANLYGFGRLVFAPGLSPETIAEEWVRAALTTDDGAVRTITGMLLRSREIYENYTAPLGVGWMVTPHYHYGVDVDGYEYSPWGTYHYADRDGIGNDRTAETGTGYVLQYGKENAALYGNIDTCPDELLLFFHHVPYTHVLHSGKTVIQHIYDSHFDGAEAVREMLESWKELEGRLDPEIYRECLKRFEMQLKNAERWRDVVNTYFLRKSGIADEHNRNIFI